MAFSPVHRREIVRLIAQTTPVGAMPDWDVVSGKIEAHTEAWPDGPPARKTIIRWWKNFCQMQREMEATAFPVPIPVSTGDDGLDPINGTMGDFLVVVQRRIRAGILHCLDPDTLDSIPPDKRARHLRTVHTLAHEMLRSSQGLALHDAPTVNVIVGDRQAIRDELEDLQLFIEATEVIDVAPESEE